MLGFEGGILAVCSWAGNKSHMLQKGLSQKYLWKLPAAPRKNKPAKKDTFDEDFVLFFSTGWEPCEE